MQSRQKSCSLYGISSVPKEQMKAHHATYQRKGQAGSLGTVFLLHLLGYRNTISIILNDGIYVWFGWLLGDLHGAPNYRNSALSVGQHFWLEDGELPNCSSRINGELHSCYHTYHIDVVSRIYTRAYVCIRIYNYPSTHINYKQSILQAAGRRSSQCTSSKKPFALLASASCVAPCHNGGSTPTSPARRRSMCICNPSCQCAAKRVEILAGRGACVHAGS